jgi:hypothetical protein
MTKWMLFVMLFTTPPYNLEKGAIKVEDEHLWELRSSSTMEFSTYRGCIDAGARIHEATEKVANLTFRGICLCESNSTITCDKQKTESGSDKAPAASLVGVPSTGSETIITSSPKAKTKTRR